MFIEVVVGLTLSLHKPNFKSKLVHINEKSQYGYIVSGA